MREVLSTHGQPSLAFGVLYCTVLLRGLLLLVLVLAFLPTAGALIAELKVVITAINSIVFDSVRFGSV